MVEKEAIYAVFLSLAVIFGTAFSSAMILSLAMNRIYPLSEPIKNLQPGQLYEVLGVARDGENCHLLLRAKADNTIRYYQLSSSQVPDLEVGDGLIKLPTGLQRLPQQFKK